MNMVEQTQHEKFPNTSFSKEDLERLKQIHMNQTGILLSDAETLEIGIALVNIHREIVQPVPDGYTIDGDDPKWQ